MPWLQNLELSPYPAHPCTVSPAPLRAGRSHKELWWYPQSISCTNGLWGWAFPPKHPHSSHCKTSSRERCPCPVALSPKPGAQVQEKGQRDPAQCPMLASGPEPCPGHEAPLLPAAPALGNFNKKPVKELSPGNFYFIEIKSFVVFWGFQMLPVPHPGLG